jgi:hypothetical protein
LRELDSKEWGKEVSLVVFQLRIAEKKEVTKYQKSELFKLSKKGARVCPKYTFRLSLLAMHYPFFKGYFVFSQKPKHHGSISNYAMIFP